MNESRANVPDAQLQEAILRTVLGRLTFGISPSSVISAYTDWLTNLAVSPGKQMELVRKAWRKIGRLALFSAQSMTRECPPCIEPLTQDSRFSHATWRTWPFNVFSQSFLLAQQWWWNATTGVRGVTRHHEDVVTFATRQWLDIFSPSNCVLTNPEVLDRTVRSGGGNLVRGALNAWEDWTRSLANGRPVGSELFQVGQNVAISPGKVVYRNNLMELIQYAPQTPSAYLEPVLIVPSWIMKYYILDLSPENSLVRFLVQHGHTVFMISWKNPDASDRDLSLNDYLEAGVMDAIDTVTKIVPQQSMHGVGYCLGGTLLAIAVAVLARAEDRRLKTLTLLASELDFSEPGELGLFIDESQIAFLEDMMWGQGYLDGKQMAGAFALLNSKDLVWSRLVHEYFMGIRRPFTDLMAWNADATRLPYKMHSEYLRRLYLDNELAKGQYKVDGRPVTLADIRIPIFAVSTERDHVSPWRSVYKINLLTETGVDFLLTSGGHNVGIVNPPPGEHYSYRVSRHAPGDKHIDAEQWITQTPVQSGSWWPYWQSWLARQSSEPDTPPAFGAPERHLPVLGEAPGTYVFAS
jgi:polyhydroxyalkanoate synthase